MHYTVLSIIALASLTVAAPTPEQAGNPWEGIIDPWGQYGNKPENVKRSNIELLNDDATNSTNFNIAGREFSPDELIQLAKRASIKDYVAHIPGCDSKDDPSNKDTPKPTWKVNQGVKIPKNGKSDQCTRGTGGQHCWTEYFLVEAAVEYFSWQPTGSAINCPAGPKDSCSSAVTSLVQSCTTTGSTWTNGMDWKILDVAGKIGLGSEGKNDITIGGSMSWVHSKTGYDLKQSCKSDSSTVTCVWNNDGTDRKELCHQVWFADRILHVWGQAQRTCNKCTGGDVQQNTGDGNVCVRGQKEFDFRLPINKLVHCNGKCGSANPGLDQPPNEQRLPYIQPADWKNVVIGPFPE